MDKTLRRRHRAVVRQYEQSVRFGLAWAQTKEDWSHLAELAESFANYLRDLAETAKEEANDVQVTERGERVQSS